MNPVIIIVQNGMAECVDVPVGVEVHIYDYDIDGVDEDKLETDETGLLYIIRRY